MNIKNILTALTLLVGLNLSASAIEPTITSGANKTFTVDLADWAAYDVDVQITDLYERILLIDNIEGAKGKIYNLKNLETGVYTVAISNSTKIINTTIKVSNIDIIVTGKEVVYRPMVNLGKEHFDVNILTQGKPVFVSVYNEDNKVFTATYTDTLAVNERFVLTQLPAGEYTISVSKGADVMKYTIVK